MTTTRSTVLRLRRDLRGILPEPDWPAGVRIRVMDKRDAKAAHAVLALGFWEGGGGAPKFGKWWSQLRKDPEYDPALCFVAVDSDGVIGMIQCWTVGFVKDVAVHPRARRRGIGRALMLTAFEAFKARGLKKVDLKVFEANEPAIALYSSIGMALVERALA